MSKKIRVWKLGSLEYGTVPSKELVDKLQKALENIHKNELTDLIWGPDIEVIELDIDTTDTNIVTDEQS